MPQSLGVHDYWGRGFQSFTCLGFVFTASCVSLCRQGPFDQRTHNSYQISKIFYET